MAAQQEYEVVLVPQPEGGFTVLVPELPEVVTEGETRDEALSMAKEAIEGYLVGRQATFRLETSLSRRTSSR